MPLLTLRFTLLCALVCLSFLARAEVIPQPTNASSISIPPTTAGQLAPLEPTLQIAPILSLGREQALEIKDDLPSSIPIIDLTTPPDDLWQRVRNGFSMPNLDSPLVANHQAWYLNRPEMLKRILDRSRLYLYHIVNELDKRGMPTELALLPIVESSYNPMAYSRARASGIWQFIPSTGKNYRLQQNWWIDQRRDIIASTSAALDYLQTIYEQHGDWHLALASYNWGEHAVARAIGKNKAKGLPMDYPNLTMPKETSNYVPKLQALKNILAQPDLFSINIIPIPNRPYFSTVEKQADMDVTVAAKLAEMPVDEFRALNPSYNRPVIPGKGSPLVIPTDKIQTFLDNLQDHEDQDKPLATWTTYTLKKGEKLNAVAAKFGLTFAHLKQINGITARTRIGAGHTLLVPGKGAQLGGNLMAVNVPHTLPELPRMKSGKRSKAGKKGITRRSAGAGKKAIKPGVRKKATIAKGKKKTVSAKNRK